MVPIHYQVVGEEDYAFDICINSDGQYHLSNGTHVSDCPLCGSLSDDQQKALLAAVSELDMPEKYPMPTDVHDAFKAELMIGAGDEALTYPFWKGELSNDSGLNRLVRLLDTL